MPGMRTLGDARQASHVCPSCARNSTFPTGAPLMALLQDGERQAALRWRPKSGSPAAMLVDGPSLEERRKNGASKRRATIMSRYVHTQMTWPTKSASRRLSIASKFTHVQPRRRPPQHLLLIASHGGVSGIRLASHVRGIVCQQGSRTPQCRR